jgi:large repetitive protein
MMVRSHLANLVLLQSRRWLATIVACAILAGPGFRTDALAEGRATRGTQSALQQGDGLTFVLRPGDVLVNSALGVLKTPSPSLTELLIVSPKLGVLRTPAPIELPPAPLISPALGVLRGSAIFGANPAVLNVGQSGQQLSIDGRGLLGAQSLVLEPSAETVVAGFTVDPSGSRIDAIIDISQNAAPGLRRLRVVDSLGNLIPEAEPGDSQILLASGLPQISSVSPNFLSNDDVYTLEIRGSNLRGLPLQNGPSFDEQPTVTISPSTGIAVAGSAQSNDAGTLVVVSVSIDANAPLIDRLIQVETSSGISSATPSPANLIHLTDAPIRVLSPFVSPQVGVTRASPPAQSERFLSSVGLGVSKGPVVTTLTPAFAAPGDSVHLVIDGHGLASTTSIVVAPAQDIEIVAGTLTVGEAQVSVDLQIAPQAQLIARRVSLISPQYRLDAPELLSLRDSPPQLNALTPSYLVRNGTSQSIELQGAHLSQVTSVSINPDTNLVIEDLVILGEELARLTLRTSGIAETGPRVITLRSPSGDSSYEPLLSNTLHIVDSGQILTPFVSPAIGVLRQTDAPPEHDQFLLSPALGIVRGQVAKTLSPRQVPRGTTTRVTVSGEQLESVDTVSLIADEGISLGNLVVANDGLSLAFDVFVAVDATVGVRRTELLAEGKRIPFVSPDAALLEIAGNVASGPIAEPDSYAATTNYPLLIDAANGVLINDHDPDGGSLYAVLRALPAHGTIALSADGGFTYTPAADFIGTDRFEYSAGSGSLVGASTAVTLNVSQVNDAVDDNYATNDNQVLDVPAPLGLLANDIIAAGESATIELATQPHLGQLDLDADGGFRYVPNGASGIDQFGYRLLSNGIRSAPAQVTITVNDLNEAPVANDDQYVVDRAHTLVISSPGVLLNDVDPDGDPMTARVVIDPLIGSLALAPNGSFTYTPPADFTGQASFRYEVSDNHGLRAQANVVINVNDHLAPLPDAYTLDEGEVLFIDAPGVLANDSIIPQGTLRIVVVQAPALGTLQIANDGSFVYRTNSPDASGEDSFRYRLEDSSVVSYPVDVRLTISAVNDPPNANADHYLTDENVEFDLAAPGVLVNDTDVDDAQLLARIGTAPAHGDVVVRPDGSLSYVPEVNFRGVDTFTYEAVDAAGATSEATVSIDVTQPPTATNDVYLVDVDTPLEVSDPLEGLLVNDHDAPEDDELTAILGALPAHGELELNPDGTFRYEPDLGYMGIDTFTYQVSDGHSSSNFGNVTLAVGITSLPRANPDSYSTNEDEQLVIDASEGVLANDTDADTPHENLQAFLVGFDWRNLTVTLAADGSFIAMPRANFYGETFFIYQVYDGTSVSNAARVNITVGPVNDGVEAVDDTYGVVRNTVFESGSRSISSNDHYDSDFPVNFEVVVPSQFGIVELDPLTGGFRYTPQLDFSGIDTFTYRVFQTDTGIADTAVVTLRTNGAPVAFPDAYSVTEDSVEQVSPGPISNDTDPDGDPIRYIYGSFQSNDGHYITLSVNDLFNPTVTTVNAHGHFYGTQTLRYIISDGTESATGTVTFTVSPVPDAPILAADNYITPRNTTLTIATTAKSVLYNDFDPDTRPYPNGPVWAAATGLDLLPISAQLISSTTHGNLVFSAIGTFTYTPDTDFSGIDEFTYRAIDGTGRQSEPALVRIRVNTPPAAVDDNYVVNEDIVLSVPASEGLLANDIDTDGDALSAVFAVSGCAPCNGRVEVRPDGSFRYFPNANFYGRDEFFYTARDGVAGTDIGRVAITVLPVNDAPYTEPDTYRTREDEVLVVPEPQGILRNDREVDGELLINAEMIDAPTHGQALLMTDGRFTYTPAVDFNGRDTFSYRVYDQSGLFSDDQVEVLVTSVNDPPIAVNDDYETPQDEILSVSALEGVLANDIDVDGPQPSVALIGLPQHGQVDLRADGSFDYQPDGIFSGIDQFQYQVDDGLGAIAAAFVNIVVRPVDPPVVIFAEDDFFSFEGPSTTISAPGVLANDHVTGAPNLLAALVVPPETGSVLLDPDGGFHYSAPAGFAGQVGFTYSASANGVSELARVTLDVRSTANVPPVAVGEQFGVLEDHLLDSRSSGSLLANDSDYEGAQLSLVVDVIPEHGAFAAQNDGHFTYQPAPDFNGSDSIVYRVSDGDRFSDPAVATITVFAQNDAPQAFDDLYHGTRNQSLLVGAASGVLANDSDVDGDALNVELVDSPAHGQVQAAPDGSFQYQPIPNFVGADHFRYAATDGAARDVAEVTLTITAGPNQPPNALGESFSLDEDSAIGSDSVGLLTANDNDPDGDPLTVLLVEAPAHGSLALDGAEFVYRPNANYFGDDGFRYSVSDGELSSEVVSTALSVLPVNDAPVAVTDLYVTEQGHPLVVSSAGGVLSNDSDIESQPLSVQLHSDVSHGVLALQIDGSFSYAANSGFLGRDEFSYELSDGEAVAIGRAIIDVTASGNQRPIAVGEVFAIAEDSVLDTRSLESLLANDVDPEGQPLSLVILSPPASGTLETFPEGHIRYVPERDAVGDVILSYAVSDGELQSAAVEVRITLLPVDDPPDAQPDLYFVPEEATELVVDATQGVLANDHDPDGETVIPSVIRLPAHGNLVLGLDGSFVYTLLAARPPHDSFRYRVSDPANNTAEAEVDLDFGSSLPTDRIFKDGFESP